MRKTKRHISAFILCILYGLIVLSPPAANVALRSPVLAHALTGECAGECGLCGCAPERSASHTCCCWQKKQSLAHMEEDQEEPDCCRKIHAEDNNKTTGISSRPCNSAKTMAVTGTEQSDALPYRYVPEVLDLVEAPVVVCHPLCLADWPGDPPDPPPKLS